MSPTLNGTTALQRFEHGNMIKILVNFYPGLPQMGLDKMGYKLWPRKIVLKVKVIRSLV